MSHQRFALVMQYDGRLFNGFQKQDHGQAVQNHLERALARISERAVTTVCAGRTDKGVHANNQVVHADLPSHIHQNAWTLGVNQYLPEGLRVLSAQVVEQSFDARFSALARTYHYLIYQGDHLPPALRGVATHCTRPLDLERLQEASHLLLGEHDFSAFRASGCQAKHARRDLQLFRWQQRGPFFLATLRANAFVYRMVRNLLGAVLPIGQGQQSLQYAKVVLQGCDRQVGYVTMPPCGLYFQQVDYAAWRLPVHDPWYGTLFEG